MRWSFVLTWYFSLLILALVKAGNGSSALELVEETYSCLIHSKLCTDVTIGLLQAVQQEKQGLFPF